MKKTEEIPLAVLLLGVREGVCAGVCACPFLLVTLSVYSTLIFVGGVWKCRTHQDGILPPSYAVNSSALCLPVLHCTVTLR